MPWDQALDIVLKNNELARQLEGNVLRIATLDTLRKEADNRAAEQAAESMAVEKVTVTRFLSYAHSKDVVATVKKFLSSRGEVISDDRTNAVIISDIPAVMPQLDRLLNQLDRKTQEVEIEARVVAATRASLGISVRSLGSVSATTLPQSVAHPQWALRRVGTFGGAPLYPIVGTSAPSPTT